MTFLIAVLAGLAVLVASWLIRLVSQSVDLKIARGESLDLYPQLDDDALERIADATRTRELAGVRRVMVAPFFGADERCSALGRALAELLRGELCLVSGLSVAARAHAPQTAYERASGVEAERQRDTCVIGGVLSLDGTLLSLRAFCVQDGEHTELSFTGEDPAALLAEAVRAFAEVLDGAITPLGQAAASVGKPRDLVTLERLGALLALSAARREKEPFAHDLELESHALDLLSDVPGLAALSELLGEHRTGDLLQSYRDNPYDVELCVRLSELLRTAESPARASLQFLRRGSELSPAYARCHALVYASVRTPERAGHHSDLAYALWPDDPFVATHHGASLAARGQGAARVVPVARGAIDLSPENPENYLRLMDAHEALGDPERALEVARELQGWLAPELDPRTYACLERDATLRARLARGEYDPAAELERRIERLTLAARRT